MTAKVLGGMIGVVSLSACLRIGTSTAAGPSAAAASSSGTSGASSGSGTGGSASGGSTGGTGSCGPSRVWIGDQCTLGSCQGAPLGSACLLSDGGIGACFGANCVAVDLHSDPNNCGAFGLRCPPPSLCLNGDCYDPTTGLSGFSIDAGNSLVCGNDGCLLSSCDAGSKGLACELPDGIPGVCCAGACAYAYNDSQNCGGCGVVCPGVCTWGVCGPFATVCGDAQNGWSCAVDGGLGICCSGACSDLRDPAHCGACETVCPIGAECVGVCIVPGSDSVPVFCASDSACPAGASCLHGTCTRSCDAQSDYEPCISDDGGAGGVGGFYSGDVCCNSACVDLESDTSNCGLCGLACSPGQVCISGGCAVLGAACVTSGPCLLGDGTLGGCCGSICVDLRNDPDNCGVCGASVVVGSICFAGTPPCIDDGDCRGGRVCLSGQCLSFSCSEGALNCALDAGGSPANGMCCGLACVGFDDPDNCGRCNAVCPPVDPDSGVWFGTGCENSAGQGCPAGSSCLTFSEDFGVFGCFRASCGADNGEQCAFGPNIFGVCCGGRCGDQSKDPDNCGACGVACPSGICSDGVCAWRDVSAPCAVSCPEGATCAFDRCISSSCELASDGCLAQDGLLGVCCSNGACAHLLDDPFNCGGCGYACPAGQSCIGGACSGSPACAAAEVGGFCNLDGGVSWVCCAGTGCTDTSSDSKNCGACGIACPSDEACRASECG